MVYNKGNVNKKVIPMAESVANTPEKQKQSANKFYLLLVAGSGTYLFLTLAAPLRRTDLTSNVSDLRLRLIQLSFVVPIILIWFCAYYGAIKFKNYAKSIEDSPDGKALNKVSNGLLILANGIILSSLFSSFRNYLTNKKVASINLKNPQDLADLRELSQNLTIISNWLALIVPLIAFTVLYFGSRHLISLVGASKKFLRFTAVFTIVVSITATIYSFMTFRNPYRNSTPDPLKHQSFYLSDLALLLTIVIPNILVWILAGLATYNISHYQRSIKGTIYKKAVRRLVLGLTSVVIVTMSFAFLSTAGRLFEKLSLKGILIVVYVIVAMYGVGYLITASGAKKLTKIEEV